MLRNCWILTSLILMALAQPLWSQAFRHDYEGTGSWFLGMDIGVSPTLNENTDMTKFLSTRVPTGTLSLGRTLTPRWSIRLQGILSSQRGFPPKVAIAYKPDVYTSYDYYCAIANLDLMFNLVNCFRHYDSRNWFDLYLVMGGGELYRFGISSNVKEWHEDVYPVDSEDKWFWDAKAGLEAAWHITRCHDLTAEIDFHTTDNAYNGVSGRGRTLDWFMTIKMGIVYYLPNLKHRHRFANPKIEHKYWKNLN